MGEQQPPFALEGRTDHTAKLFRRVFGSFVQTPGVADIAATWKVTQRGAGADRSVDVATGTGWIPQFADNGPYAGYSDSVVNVPLAVNSSGLTRIDTIVAQIHDAELFGGNDDWVFVPVQGTPSATPVPPAVPNTSLPLADVQLANGFATVVNANIADRRVPIQTRGQPVISKMTQNIGIQSNIATVTTDAVTGKFTITYPVAFNSIIAVFAQPTDAGAAFDTTIYPQVAQSNSQLTATVYSNGVLQTSRTLSVWWEAMGT